MTCSQTKSRQNGFTLKELMVVVGCVSVLISVSIPMAIGNQSGSSAATCRANVKQIMQAWSMYHADHEGRIAPAGGGGPSAGKVAGNESWMGGWLDYTSSFDNVNTDLLVNRDKYPYAAHLGIYLQMNAQVFRCPDDKSTVAIFGRQFNRVRSVSINNWMGGVVWAGATEFRVYQNISEITAPAYRWVLTEELYASINDSLLAVEIRNEIQVDYPGYLHNSGCFFGMSDGSAIYKRWVDPRSTPPIGEGQLLPLNVPSPNNIDLAWLRQRTTELR